MLLLELLMSDNLLSILHEKYQIDKVNWELAMAHLIMTETYLKKPNNLDLPQPLMDYKSLPQGVLLRKNEQDHRSKFLSPAPWLRE